MYRESCYGRERAPRGGEKAREDAGCHATVAGNRGKRETRRGIRLNGEIFARDFPTQGSRFRALPRFYPLRRNAGARKTSRSAVSRRSANRELDKGHFVLLLSKKREKEKERD